MRSARAPSMERSSMPTPEGILLLVSDPFFDLFVGKSYQDKLK